MLFQIIICFVCLVVVVINLVILCPGNIGRTNKFPFDRAEAFSRIIG